MYGSYDGWMDGWSFSGKVTTYKILAHILESSPRAVGQALKRNPYAPRVPCHRVIANNRCIGGYQGQWSQGSLIDKKRALLLSEGIPLDDQGFLHETDFIYIFDENIQEGNTF
jgi:methylated-DNA-[protein]-cysteine S-methyltransferase